MRGKGHFAAWSLLVAIVLIAGTVPGASAQTASGSITGLVTADGSGVPLEGICVAATEDEGIGPLHFVYTDASGVYRIDDLAAGMYRVEFWDFNCGPDPIWATEYYNDKYDQFEADLVSVSGGQTTTGINASLVLAGSISGKVTDSSGAALSGICVYAQSPVGSLGRGSPFTGETGEYRIDGLAPGSYLVEFRDCVEPLTWAPEYYNDTYSFDPDLVEVASGETTPGIDASLVPAGSISGKVTTTTGTGLSGVCVRAMHSSGGIPKEYASADDGTYVIHGLPPGYYRVQFQDCTDPITWASEYYDDTYHYFEADHVEVISGETTTGINASLEQAGSVSGRVTDAGGTGLSGICIFPRLDGDSVGLVSISNTDGAYRIDGLPPGYYQVVFRDCFGSRNWATEYYNDSYSATDAELVEIVAGATTEGINATLAAAATITGMVTDGSGAPLPGICVYALKDGHNDGFPGTGSDGTYEIGGLPPGSYRVVFSDCGAPVEWVREYYDDAPGYADATVITLTEGETVAGINAVLAGGGFIAGSVTDGSNPIAGICAAAISESGWGFSSPSGPDGSYVIGGLATGTYTLRFDDCAEPIEWATEHYQSQASQLDATPVPVTAGLTTDIEAVILARGGTVSGQATDSETGLPVRDICVSLVLPGGDPYKSVTTGTKGTYRISGVAEGSYKVAFVDCSSTRTTLYGEQWFNHQPSEDLADLVTVTADAVAGGIDAVLGGAPPGDESVSGAVDAGGSVTTNDGSGATVQDPVETTVASPNAGTVALLEAYSGGGTSGGWTMLGWSVDISAPAASTDDPLEIEFILDASLLPADVSGLTVFRNGVAVAPCGDGESATTASPDPCEKTRLVSATTGDLSIVILTSVASMWTFGAPSPLPPSSPPAVEVLGVVIENPCVNAPSAGFVDVSPSSVHQPDIDCLMHLGITTGLTATTYHPTGVVTREQMALFLTRLLNVAGVALPTPSSNAFSDIGGLPAGSQKAINQLALLNIARGVTATSYDPAGVLTREQVALFLARALAAAGVELPVVTSNAFGDTGGLSEEARRAINQLALLNIAKGTTQGSYSPGGAVTREQIASFIARSLAHTGATVG